MLNVIDLLDLSHIEETIGADFGLLNLKTFNMQHGLYNTLKEKVSFKTLFGIVCILCDLVPPTPPPSFVVQHKCRNVTIVRCYVTLFANSTHHDN